MRRLCLLFLAILLCSSCSYYDKQLNELRGANIDEAVAILGEPSEKDFGSYTWLKDVREQRGGYHRTEYETAYTYDNKGKVIATTQIPFRVWVEPYVVRKWCKMVITFMPDGTIFDYSFDGNDCPGFW